MTHTIAAAILVAGLALPATAGEMQPDPLSSHMSGYFYSAGHSYLGIDIRDVTSDRVNALKLKEERGVEIMMVDQDAPAGKAGLREHDVILDFNGTAVESEEQLRRLIREMPPGRTVTLGISRDGQPIKVSAQLADHSKMAAQNYPHMPLPPGHMPAFPRNSIDIPNIQVQTYSSILGMQTEGLTRQLGEFFGVKDGEGILIRSVEKGSAADKAGLKAGDVMVRADNEKLTDRSDLLHAVRKHPEAGKMSLVVVRDKREQTIVLPLPDRGARDSSGLVLDMQELQASLGNMDEMVAALNTRDLESLGGNLKELGSNLELLQLENQDRTLLQLVPDTGETMQNAQEEIERVHKMLKDLLKHSDPI